MKLRLECLLFAIVELQIITVCFSQSSIGDRCSISNGRNGVCQLGRDCQSAQEDLKKGIRPKICGFQGRDPIVCCNQQTPTTMSKPIVSRVHEDIARQWCEKYSGPCPIFVAVAGGKPALPGEFPHMAAIGYGDQNRITWNCGGTLISEKFILTAAHCISSRETGPARWVLLGSVSLVNTTSSDGRLGQIHPVIRRIRHPDYKPPSKYNDIALFEFGAAVTPNPRSLTTKELHPACLSENRTFPGQKAIATGWGRVGHGDDGSPELLKVWLDVFELSTCQKAYDVEIKSTSQLRKGIDSTMLCAGVLEGKRDTCQGDSGGPLQTPVIRECMYEVWGVTSFGKICAFPNSPSVYTRVHSYIPWIVDIVWPE